MRMHIKRCLIDFQKGVSNRAKGHLLQVNWALIKMQFVLFENKDVKIYDKAGNIPLSLSQ